MEDDGFFVAQCLDIDVASDGTDASDALVNLAEALTLYGESEDWEPILVPGEPIALTEDQRAWINMSPVGREQG